VQPYLAVPRLPIPTGPGLALFGYQRVLGAIIVEGVKARTADNSLISIATAPLYTSGLATHFVCC
jgi:hypothetical protein